MIRAVIILFSMLALACTSKKHTRSDLAGVWYLVTNDSVYDEVIFTKDRFWSWSERSGQLAGRYVVANDSFKYLQLSGQLMRGLNFKQISEDEFMIMDGGFRSHFFRLNIPLDTSTLMNSKDMILMDGYRSTIATRRSNWKAANRLQAKGQ